jgi:Zn-dependent protease
MSQAAPGAEPRASRRFGRDARGGFPLFRIAQVQVRVDPSWFLIFVLIWWSLSAGYFPRLHPDASGLEIWTAGLLTSLLFFLSLLFHELSHAFVARRAGLEVPSITLFLFGGASEMSREPDDPGTELRVAAVGPLASFALALAFWAVGRVLPAQTPALLLGVLGYLAWINLALGVFNLLPGFPLDGGRILRALLWRRTGSLQRASRVATQAGKGLGLGLAILGGIQIFSGALVGGVWLVLIGLFARGLAETSYQSLILRQLLAQVTVGEVMVRDPVSVPAELPLDRLVEDYILGRGFRAFPVVEGDRTLGLVSLEGIKAVPPDERPTRRVRDHLEPLDPERAVTPETPLVDALAKMSRLGARRLPVLRPSSEEVVGLLTQGGLSRFVELRRGLAAGEADAAPDAPLRSSASSR